MAVEDSHTECQRELWPMGPVISTRQIARGVVSAILHVLNEREGTYRRELASFKIQTSAIERPTESVAPECLLPASSVITTKPHRYHLPFHFASYLQSRRLSPFGTGFRCSLEVICGQVDGREVGKSLQVSSKRCRSGRPKGQRVVNCSVVWIVETL